MELAMSSAIALLVFAGVYLVLRARSFDVILGLTLLSLNFLGDALRARLDPRRVKG